MRRRRALVVLGLFAIVGAGGSFAGPSRPEPPPQLANGAAWHLPAHVESQADDAAWLHAGAVPGPESRRDVVERALLDLRALTTDDGAVRAGPSGIWAYAWPRDSSFAAAAFAVTGHRGEAWRVMSFLARVQLPDGGFEARYTLDGAGPPDDRQRQADGAGWVLWALDEVRRRDGGSRDDLGPPLPVRFRPMRDRAVDYVLGLTGGAMHLPAAGPDYWEVPERLPTLGTVAPLAAGLEAAARSVAAEGDASRAESLAAAAGRLRALASRWFGPTYGRHGTGSPRDAAVTMLLPPFAGAVDEGAARASKQYAVEALRPAGGLAPGVGWKDDGVSWTPETALVAYTAAASGRVAEAERWLDWLGRHRTSWGSLPEKVRADGRPAGPAPLAWTAALVVLTEQALDERHVQQSVGDPGELTGD